MSQTIESEPEIASAPTIRSLISSEVAPALSSKTDELPQSPPDSHEPEASADSLFERFAWLYVFFREKLFRDDSDRIIQALWPQQQPPAGTKVIELGCGPGFYSCEIAARFPAVSVLGVDRSKSQLHFAREKKWKQQLENCRFECDDVLDLSHDEQSYDAVIAARLFTVLQDRTRAVSEMHRILRSGGRCLIAEPRFAFWASLPLLALWLVAAGTRMSQRFCEPRKATVLSPTAFKALFATQPWRKIETWQDGRYQYALCEKV